MLDRLERPIRITCLVLAAILVLQLASVILRRDPLAHLTIPALPTLPPPTNAAPADAPALAKPPEQGTNHPAGKETAKGETNSGAMGALGTNAPARAGANTSTNVLAGTNAGAGATNSLAEGSHSPGRRGAGARDTNAVARRGGRGLGAAAGMAGMMPGGRRGGPPLAPAIQARVDEITDSEIFGPVMHPMPMALIGIADDEAFIRAPNGQTGPLKTGGELGGIKLVRIGVNRVLVEEAGEKKELTLFNGVGGESLMPQATNAPGTNAAAANAATNLISLTKTNAATTNKMLSSKQKDIH